MSRIISVMFAILIFLSQSTQAQEQNKRVEISFSIGGHSILNDMEPSPPGTTGYFGGHLLYHITETQSIGIRYGAAPYEIVSTVNSTEAWMGDIFATYRYTWRKGKPTRIYLEIGLGACDPVPLYDEGIKAGGTFAFGVKRFLGKKFSLGLDLRGVSFDQEESFFSSDTVTTRINETSLTLGYLF